ncbi:MAG: hypothetical protein J6K39_01415 [Clostridia bacterium]|nr:hypothetical protein [Clostridia bacterium]
MEQRKPFIPPPPPPRGAKKEELETESVSEKKIVPPQRPSMPKFPPNFPKKPPKLSEGEQKTKDETEVASKTAKVSLDKQDNMTTVAEGNVVTANENGQENVVDEAVELKGFVEMEDFELGQESEVEISGEKVEEKNEKKDPFDDLDFLLTEEEKETSVAEKEQTSAKKSTAKKLDKDKLEMKAENEKEKDEVDEIFEQTPHKGVNWHLIAGWGGFIVSAVAFAIFIYLLIK